MEEGGGGREGGREGERGDGEGGRRGREGRREGEGERGGGRERKYLIIETVYMYIHDISYYNKYNT